MNLKLFILLLSIALLAGCARQDNLYKQKPAFYSYIIGDIKSGHIEDENNADVSTTPASCQKTITALLAYKLLGSDYRYETRLYSRTKNDKLQDILIEFSGDPELTSADLTKLLAPIKGHTIEGKIILDASLFKTPPHSTYLMISDIGTKSGAPVSAINIDKNLISVTIKPYLPGEKASIFVNPKYSIESSVITSSDQTAARSFWHGNIIKAIGNINLTDPPLEQKLSPKEIEPYIVDKVQAILKKLKIKGRVQIVHDKSKLPTGLTLLVKHQSLPFGEIIPPALKISDNLVFDSLYLKIVHSHNPAGIDDWSDGDKTIQALIKQHFNIDMENSFIIDGSGISRYNRIEPRKLFEILKQGYEMPEFVAALAVPGEVKSTFIKRTALPNNLRVKDGALAGVRCLCGYSTGDRPKAFVIIANGFSPPAHEVLTVIDKFIKDKLQ